MFADDALGDPEAEAGAAFALGGEEGLEEVVADLGRDAGAVVDDFDDGAGFEWLVSGIDAGPLRDDADQDGAAFAGCFGGVGDEVGEDLAEFGGESIDDDSGGSSEVTVTPMELKRPSISSSRSSSVSLRLTGTGALDSR